jgi:hypothetical protein
LFGASSLTYASWIFRLRCGNHSLQSASQCPLKEKHDVGGKATELSTPPNEGRFSLKIKIQSNDDSDFDSVSDEDGQEKASAH